MCAPECFIGLGLMAVGFLIRYLAKLSAEVRTEYYANLNDELKRIENEDS